MSNESCKHEGCNCKVPAGRTDGYCDDYCKKHGEKPGHAKHDCSCGHPDCGKH
jgi:hypothetical protein